MNDYKKDANFIEWLRIYGHDPAEALNAGWIHELRLKYEIEQHEAEDRTTVAEVLGSNRQGLDDFAFFMLGLESRRTFHVSCNIRHKQSPKVFDFCWRVFDTWAAWQEDFSRSCNN